MSLSLINAVFASNLDPYERLVMLALADRADDATGACYPSIPDICARTGMKERGVQNVVKRLVEVGVLEVNWGGGRHQRNTYFIKINPAPDAGYSEKPRTENTVSHAETPHAITETPHPITINPAPDAGEPSITTIEPREEKVTRFPAPDLSPCFSHFNAVAAKVGWSQVQRQTPERRAALSRRISEIGSEVAWCEAIDRASRSPLLTGQEGSGWRADFDWLAKPANFTKLMEGNYDPRNSKHQSQQTSNGRSNRADPAIEQIARLTGLGPAQGGCGGGIGGFGEEDGPFRMGARPQ